MPPATRLAPVPVCFISRPRNANLLRLRSAYLPAECRLSPARRACRPAFEADPPRATKLDEVALARLPTDAIAGVEAKAADSIPAKRLDAPATAVPKAPNDANPRNFKNMATAFNADTIPIRTGPTSVSMIAENASARP